MDTIHPLLRPEIQRPQKGLTGYIADESVAIQLEICKLARHMDGHLIQNISKGRAFDTQPYSRSGMDRSQFRRGP